MYQLEPLSATIIPWWGSTPLLIPPYRLGSELWRVCHVDSLPDTMVHL